jgi:hypothetical protein
MFHTVTPHLNNTPIFLELEEFSPNWMPLTEAGLARTVQDTTWKLYPSIQSICKLFNSRRRLASDSCSLFSMGIINQLIFNMNLMFYLMLKFLLVFVIAT